MRFGKLLLQIPKTKEEIIFICFPFLRRSKFIAKCVPWLETAWSGWILLIKLTVASCSNIVIILIYFYNFVEFFLSFQCYWNVVSFLVRIINSNIFISEQFISFFHHIFVFSWQILCLLFQSIAHWFLIIFYMKFHRFNEFIWEQNFHQFFDFFSRLCFLCTFFSSSITNFFLLNDTKTVLIVQPNQPFSHTFFDSIFIVPHFNYFRCFF